jgi:hypothetical protein
MFKTLIFASALSLFMAGPAAAAAVTPVTITMLSGIDYEVTLLYGTFDQNILQITSTPWWGDGEAAAHAAGSFFNRPYEGGPEQVLFAYSFDGNFGVGARETLRGGLLYDNGYLHLSVHPYAYAVIAPVTAVPVPAAGWLFMSALIGLMGKKRLSRRSVH